MKDEVTSRQEAFKASLFGLKKLTRREFTKLLKECGLTRYDICEILGIKYASIKNWGTGAEFPTYLTSWLINYKTALNLFNLEKEIIKKPTKKKSSGNMTLALFASKLKNEASLKKHHFAKMTGMTYGMVNSWKEDSDIPTWVDSWLKYYADAKEGEKLKAITDSSPSEKYETREEREKRIETTLVKKRLNEVKGKDLTVESFENKLNELFLTERAFANKANVSSSVVKGWLESNEFPDWVDSWLNNYAGAQEYYELRSNMTY